MIRILTLAITLLSFSYNIYSQGYVRPSLSLLPLNGSKINLIDAVPGNSYDYVSISDIEIKLDEVNSDAIAKYIVSNKISNRVYAETFSIVDGRYDFAALDRKGRYGATDSDVNLTSQMMNADQQGRFTNLIMLQVPKTYIAVYTGTFEESETNSEGIKSKNYQSEGTYYLYRLKVDKALSTNEVMDVVIEVEYVNTGVYLANEGQSEITGTLKFLNKKKDKVKTEEEMIEDLKAKSVTAMALQWRDNVLDFQPLSTLEKGNRVNLGKKEDLRVDELFYAYQQVEDENGNRELIKKANLRVRKVADNVGVSSGDSDKSKLFKVGYGNARTGYTVKFKKELGIGVFAGFGTPGSPDWMRVTYRLKGTTPGAMVYLGINPLIGNETVLGGGLPATQTQTAVGFGIQKQFTIIPVVYLTPFVGATYVQLGTTKQNAEGTFSNFGAHAGLRLGIHITNKLSFQANINYLAGDWYNQWLDNYGWKVSDGAYGWTAVIPDIPSLSLTAGFKWDFLPNDKK